ncbi:hypothetical protein [Salegentibacter maritimus]|uniref:hypothetical protein n=1 Tax=Salegentibacter maritimus TaxID=2794347 RepID=UPI0018E461C1|nr:hypothetical protein [Salegentibacter maritimus]MBI6116141.1 hypothetical protein [Salegentibacter maritimus]
MTKFLELTYYKNREFVFPKHLKPNIERSSVGIQTHYIDLSNSRYGEEVFEQFHKNTDINLIEDLIDQHGIFFEKFLAAKFRQRILTFFINEEKSSFLLQNCKEYYGKIKKRNILIDKIKDDFQKISLIRLINDALYKKLQSSQLEKSKPKECAICKNLYKPIKLPDWVYYGSNGNDSICYECPIVQTQSKQEIQRLIKELIGKINFIPNADLNPINHNFSSRVKKECWIDTCKIIFQIGISGNDILSSESVLKKKFGSWFKALVASNILPKGVLESSRGVRCIAKSGNECNSLDEMFIDNWLFANNVISIKEPLYPKHPIYNKTGRRRADWRVGDYYIEYFGLKGEEAYDKKTKEKLLLADDLNLELISLFPSDLNNISAKLDFLINKYHK